MGETPACLQPRVEKAFRCAVFTPWAGPLSTCTECAAPLASAARASDVCEHCSLSWAVLCDAMLRAGRVPVAYRGARVKSGCVERLILNSFGVPARAGRLQHPLGFCALRRASLFVPAPHLAIYARRESRFGAPLRLRSRGERAAEVRPVLCLTQLVTHLSRRRRRRLTRPSRCG